MDPTDAFTTLAEIAATLAGFTGIIVVLRPNTASEEQTTRVLHVLIICFMIIIGALLPFALSAFGLSDGNVWRYSCCLLGATLLAFNLWGIVSFKKGLLTPTFPKIMFGNMLLAAIVSFCLIASAIGVFIEASPAILLAALIYLLIFASHAFTASLIWVFRNDA